MMGPIARYLADDHARLDALLTRGATDSAAYADFRRGLLRHIGMEEKILLPAAQRARGGEPLPAAARLRLDHGALAALLVPTPTPAIRAALRGILERHNALEEGPGSSVENAVNALAPDDRLSLHHVAATAHAGGEYPGPAVARRGLARGDGLTIGLVPVLLSLALVALRGDSQRPGRPAGHGPAPKSAWRTR